MKTSVFVTTAQLGFDTGGGNVAYHEWKALTNVTEVQKCLSREDLYPPKYNLPDNPFFYDYLASNLMRDTKVDIVMFNGNPFWLTTKALAPAKTIVDVPAHDLELSMEEFQRLGIKYPFVHMTDPFLWELYTRHIKMADIVLCPSKLSANYITKKLALTNKVVVIPHGCELPQETKPLPENFTIAHVGVNGPDKGQIYLVKAWNSLNLQNAKILLAGYGTENWGGLGHIEDVNKIYEQCSVFVQPSVTEGFGIPVLEAMAHGRPVIVSEGCGSSELVENGKEGFIVPIRSPEALAEKVRYFYDRPDEVERMGQKARVTAMNYSWEKIGRQYEELYESV